MSRSALDTPMMRQYLAIKARHPEAIVFYRMGDFYEMFLADAELAAPLLDIALTTRDKGKEDAVAMCGVPVHAADQHIKRLAELGYRVAVCEQVEDAKAAGGRRLVRREVVEVVTPGLVGDPAGIEAARELVLVALAPGERVGMAAFDASTGDLRATEVARSQDGEPLPAALVDELRRIDPREVIVPEGAFGLEDALRRCLAGVPLGGVEAAQFEPAVAPVHPDGLSPDATDAASRAVAALLSYVSRNQPAALVHTPRLHRYALGEAMILDEATRAHLELFRNSEDGTRARTLVERLDETATPMGARRLARWIAYPLLDPAEIARRQDAVAYLAERDRCRQRLRDALRPVRDLERILAKAARPGATPRDLVALRASLEALPAVREAMGQTDALIDAPEDRPEALALPAAVPEAATLLREALVEEPPALLRGSRGAGETGYIRPGFHAELDGLHEGARKGREWIAGLEAEERKRSGISSLKVRFHPVHGYSIEVTKAQLARVPGHYERKQTLANAERFTTAELREVEQKVLGATERAALLEREIFEKVRQAALEWARPIREAADAVATLDATASLAEVARRDRWIRPVVDAGEALEIRAGRHPVVEPLLAARGAEEFVPNDTELDTHARQILVLTGPNMSGKSTYLRQVALIVLLAQMGSFVPADSARVGVVDRVFTRVGASDRLARGESTFMVEMRETAEILSQATRRSLIILDEIGRGTSTFDGLSIAWAVAEHLHDAPGLRARTLFATHYHELTDLARTKPRVDNAHFQAREWGEEVLFLRRLIAGGASRSYGIQVARLAGLPPAVIERAREILKNLEGGEVDERGRPRLASHEDATDAEDSAEPGEQAQLGLFAPPPLAAAEREALEALRRIDPERTTPLEALELLVALRERLAQETDS
ncbi:MAG TPA: DNA mismatch repair protein MutS [Myxococcota bacterium]